MKRLTGFGRTAGQTPGAVDPVLMADEAETRIRIHAFDADTTSVVESCELDDIRRAMKGNLICWIRITGLRNADLIQDICREFSLHPLLVEDIFNRFQRPKIELEDDIIMASLNAVSDEDLNTHPSRNLLHVSVLLSGSVVVTFEEKQIQLLEQVEQRIANCQGRVRKSGSDYLFYSILDVIVDGYFLALEGMSDRIEELEEKLAKESAPEILEGIQKLRTRMLMFRKSVWPLREVVNELSREESTLICDTTVAYLRDLYDHTVQVIDTTETLREILSGMVDTYLSSISNRMNKVMQVLTIVATIFIPLTFIAGVYGMNFHHMPELPAKWGYPAILSVMLLVAIGMLLFFRRKKWL